MCVFVCARVLDAGEGVGVRDWANRGCSAGDEPAVSYSTAGLLSRQVRVRRVYLKLDRVVSCWGGSEGASCARCMAGVVVGENVCGEQLFNECS